MKGIFFMWRRSIRNYFLWALKKPWVLLLYLLFIAMIVFAVFVGGSNGTMPQEKNIAGYSAVLLGFFGFVAIMTMMNGLKQGTALFTMADVNFLFPSPVPPDKILVGAVAKQAGIILLASVFMVAQYPNMKMSAGLDGIAIVGLIAGYAGMGITMNLFSALLYAFCAGAPERRKRLYQCLVGLGTAIFLWFAYTLLREGDMARALLRIFSAEAWSYVPFVGWGRGVAVSMAEHAYWKAAVYLTLLCGGGMTCMALLRRSDMDYFEDVLLAAERATQVQMDAKEGRISQTGSVSERVKRELGPLKGKHAWAVTSRILREQKRGSIGWADVNTFVAAGTPLVWLIFGGSAQMGAEVQLWPLFSMLAWLMVFANLKSGYIREFTYPLLYLIPASSFQKLLAIIAPQVLKAVFDGAVFAVAANVMLRISPMQAGVAFLFYLTLSLLYQAGYLLIERLLGSLKNRMLVLFLYIGILLLLFIPGMVLSLILSSGWIPGMGYFLCMAWNVGMALLLMCLCRNLLTRVDVT